jgi:hypothetical protein
MEVNASLFDTVDCLIMSVEATFVLPQDGTCSGIGFDQFVDGCGKPNNRKAENASNYGEHRRYNQKI